jgi:hypothetical protein
MKHLLFWAIALQRKNWDFRYFDEKIKILNFLGHLMETNQIFDPFFGISIKNYPIAKFLKKFLLNLPLKIWAISPHGDAIL